MDLAKGRKAARSSVPGRLTSPDLVAQHRLAGSCEALRRAVPADTFGALTEAPVLTVPEQAAIKVAGL